MFFGYRRNLIFKNIGNGYVGAFGDQMIHQIATYVSNALNNHFFTVERFRAEGFLGRSFHSHVNAISGNGRWISGTTFVFGKPGHVFGFGRNVFHVLLGGTNVFRRDVLPIHAFNEFSVAAEQRFAFVLTWITENNGFSTTQIQTRNRCFVGHPLR
jgi:hypothetical protein